MPSRNIVKKYVENGYYHVYNRGVEKRNIFLGPQDYNVFLGYLRDYLSPTPTEEIKTNRNGYVCKDFSKGINLLAFCLMPNHFHLLVKQKKEREIASLMKCLSTRYSMYFNKKYQRTGHLFQGAYKAALISNDEYLMHLSRYIHLNPRGANIDYENYDYSSYDCYIKGKQTNWLNKAEILSQFKGSAGYKSFIEELATDSAEILGSLTLEEMHRVSPCAKGEKK